VAERAAADSMAVSPRSSAVSQCNRRPSGGGSNARFSSCIHRSLKVNTHTGARTCACVCVCIQECMYVRTYSHTHAHTHKCLCVCVGVCVCVCVCVCHYVCVWLCGYTHMYMYIHMHARMYKRAQTYAHTPPPCFRQPRSATAEYQIMSILQGPRGQDGRACQYIHACQYVHFYTCMCI
jgi:hypothetical protein